MLSKVEITLNTLSLVFLVASHLKHELVFFYVSTPLFLLSLFIFLLRSK